jgi:hypothetical protein
MKAFFTALLRRSFNSIFKPKFYSDSEPSYRRVTGVARIIANLF